MWKKFAFLSAGAVVLLVLIFVVFEFFRKKEESGFITLYGNVDVRQVDISFRVMGRVVGVPYEEGDFVPRGALMSTLEEQPYADQVKESQANIESIRKNLANAEDIFHRREELICVGGVSQEDYENARTQRDVYIANLIEAEAALGVAMKNYNDTKVFCPTDGTILSRIREPGTVVEPTEPVYTLSVLSPVWVRAFIPEPYLGDIYPGMPAEIYTDSQPNHPYKGYLGFISPMAEFTPKTVETMELRTDLVYRLRVYADNPDWGLRQGMPVTVKLRKEPGKRFPNGSRPNQQVN